MHFAARFGMDGAAEALLDAGASTRLKNAAGQTPADIARGQRWGDDAGALLAALARPGSNVAMDENDEQGGGASPALEEGHLMDSADAAASGGGWYEPEPSCDASGTGGTDDLLPELDTSECTTVESLDWPTFQRRFMALNRPVLVRRPAVASAGWRAWERWQRGALRRHYGSLPVKPGVIPCASPLSSLAVRVFACAKDVGLDFGYCG